MNSEYLNHVKVQNDLSNHAETLIPVEKIPHQRYLYEKDFGNAKQEDIQNYLKDISNSC